MPEKCQIHLVSPGAGRNNNASCFLGSNPWRVAWRGVCTSGRPERAGIPAASYNVLWSLGVLSMLDYQMTAVSWLKWATVSGQKGASEGRVLQGFPQGFLCEGGDLHSASEGRHRWAQGLLRWLCASKKKKQSWSLSYRRYYAKRCSSGSAVVASQFTSVDTIPNAVRLTRQKFFSFGGFPACACWTGALRMDTTSSPGARSARRFEELCLCRWTAGREPGTLSGSSTRKIGKCHFLKISQNFMVALDWRGIVENYLWGWWALTLSQRLKRETF